MKSGVLHSIIGRVPNSLLLPAAYATTYVQTEFKDVYILSADDKHHPAYTVGFYDFKTIYYSSDLLIYLLTYLLIVQLLDNAKIAVEEID